MIRLSWAFLGENHLFGIVTNLKLHGETVPLFAILCSFSEHPHGGNGLPLSLFLSIDSRLICVPVTVRKPRRGWRVWHLTHSCAGGAGRFLPAIVLHLDSLLTCTWLCETPMCRSIFMVRLTHLYAVFQEAAGNCWVDDLMFENFDTCVHSARGNCWNRKRFASTITPALRITFSGYAHCCVESYVSLGKRKVLPCCDGDRANADVIDLILFWYWRRWSCSYWCRWIFYDCNWLWRWWIDDDRNVVLFTYLDQLTFWI